MATEEELRDAEISKIKIEAALSQEQLRELQRKSRIVSRISQGLGVGVVLSLAGMALFGPIKDTLEAESKLATLNAAIADRQNANLMQQLKNRQKQLKSQEVKYEKNLSDLAKELRKSNLMRDNEIIRRKALVNRERSLAEKYRLMAEQNSESEQLLLEAQNASMRAKDLENEIAKLKKDAETGRAKADQVQDKVNFRPLANYSIRIDGEVIPVQSTKKQLSDVGISSYSLEHFNCRRAETSLLIYYDKKDEDMAKLLEKAIYPVLPNLEIKFSDFDLDLDLENDNQFLICAIETIKF